MKTLTITLAGLALALTPALAAPPIQAGTGTALSAPAGQPTSVQIVSGGKVVATMTLPQGAASIKADNISYSEASKSMTLKGHVSVSVTQGGQSVFHLNADEARVVVQTPSAPR